MDHGTDTSVDLPVRRLRMLAIALTALWAALGVGLVVVQAQSVDLLGILAAAIPMVIALSIVVRPARWPDAPYNMLQSLILSAALLLVPLLAALGDALRSSDRQLVGLSVEFVLAAGVSLVLTAFVAGLGLATGRSSDQRDRPLWSASQLAIVSVTIAGLGTFGIASLAYTVRADEGDTFPRCDTPFRISSSARVEMTAEADLDGTLIGEASLEGVRQLDAARWSMNLELPWHSGTAESIEMDGQHWTQEDGAGWRRRKAESAPPPDAENELTPVEGLLDQAVSSVILGRDDRPIGEDRGIERLDMGLARHCRTLIDGASALGAFPPLRWIAGRDPFDRYDIPPDRGGIRSWRGEIDWWLTRDATLIMADVQLTGYPVDVWPVDGLQATLSVSLRISDRGSSFPIDPPRIEDQAEEG